MANKHNRGFFLETKEDDHNHHNTLVIDRQYLVFTNVEMIYPWWGIMNQQPSFATRAVVEMSHDKSRPKLLLLKRERNNFANFQNTFNIDWCF